MLSSRIRPFALLLFAKPAALWIEIIFLTCIKEFLQFNFCRLLCIRLRCKLLVCVCNCDCHFAVLSDGIC